MARREFAEELGTAVTGALTALGNVRQAGGKVVHAWTAAGDFDPSKLHSNTFELEWPPRSGRRERFPEVDRAEWFDLDMARNKLLPAQRELLDRLVALLESEPTA